MFKLIVPAAGFAALLALSTSVPTLAATSALGPSAAAPAVAPVDVSTQAKQDSQCEYLLAGIIPGATSADYATCNNWQVRNFFKPTGNGGGNLAATITKTVRSQKSPGLRRGETEARVQTGWATNRTRQGNGSLEA